ncbi:MAG: FAD-dependent oxidoreductase, partial [Pseudomonadota bacterium]
MRRAYPASAYDPAPPPSYWASTIPEATQRRTPVERDMVVGTAIIGAGVTGLNAALTLAKAGEEAVVFDASYPGWGASGRNGGFCCVGGDGRGYDAMVRDHGMPQTQAYVSHQMAAVEHVAGLLDRHGIDADRHSDGEWELAHSDKAYQGGADYVELEKRLGLGMTAFSKSELAEQGIAGGFVHGGWRRRPGFALNPLKYVTGLARAAE